MEAKGAPEKTFDGLVWPWQIGTHSIHPGFIHSRGRIITIYNCSLGHWVLPFWRDTNVRCDCLKKETNKARARQLGLCHHHCLSVTCRPYKIWTIIQLVDARNAMLLPADIDPIALIHPPPLRDKRCQCLQWSKPYSHKVTTWWAWNKFPFPFLERKLSNFVAKKIWTNKTMIILTVSRFTGWTGSNS